MMKQLVSSFFIYSALSQITPATTSANLIITPCFLKCLGQPLSKVCGYNNITYNNECYAKCADTTVNYPGTCFFCLGIICDTSYAPVCGVDGITHKNLCQLICYDNVGFNFYGTCPPKPNCLCRYTNSPIIGVNGVCYKNQCLANRASMKTESYLPCLILLPPVIIAASP